MTSDQLITTLVGDISTGANVYYAAAGIAGIIALVFLMVIGYLMLVPMLNYSKQINKTSIWYKSTVCAYKVGYIQKYAEDNDIKLVHPPNTDLMAELNDTIQSEISKE